MQAINSHPQDIPADAQATNTSASATSETRSNCLLIRVDKLQLIVPRLLVAEVVDLEGITFTSSLNKDIKIFEWRDYQVPLVSSNVLTANGSTQIQRHSKIIVFHAVLNREKLPFYALIASTNPRLIAVSTATITEHTNIQNQPSTEADILMSVIVEGEMAVIPRVQQLEKIILDSLPNRN